MVTPASAAATRSHIQAELRAASARHMQQGEVGAGVVAGAERRRGRARRQDAELGAGAGEEALLARRKQLLGAAGALRARRNARCGRSPLADAEERPVDDQKVVLVLAAQHTRPAIAYGDYLVVGADLPGRGT